MKRLMCVLAAVVALSPFNALAAWEAPKDGVVTEKQVVAYKQVMKEWVEVLKASGKAAEGASGAAAIGVMSAADARFKAALAKAGLSQEEFNWIGEKVWEARGALMVTEMFTKGRQEMAANVKKNADEQAAAKAKIARYEAAVKSGRRVLDDEDRKHAIESAKEELKGLQEEVKQYEQDAKAAADEAKRYDAEAKKALALAAKPPADVPADDRADYIAAQKEEAASAAAAAKEQREQEAEIRKSIAETQARAAAAKARIADPEVVSAEEAADVKQQNQDYLESARAELKTLEQAQVFMNQAVAQMEQQAAEMMAKVNKQNAEVVQKHIADLDALFGGK